MELEGYGIVNEEGQIVIYNKSSFDNRIIKHFQGKKIKFTVEEHFTPISSKLRRYYFGPFLSHVVKAYKEIGDVITKKQADEKIRDAFLFIEEVDTETGEIVKRILSLSKEANEVNNSMMVSVINLVVKWIAEFTGYQIPLPNEY